MVVGYHHLRKPPYIYITYYIICISRVKLDVKRWHAFSIVVVELKLDPNERHNGAGGQITGLHELFPRREVWFYFCKSLEVRVLKVVESGYLTHICTPMYVYFWGLTPPPHPRKGLKAARDDFWRWFSPRSPRVSQKNLCVKTSQRRGNE